MSVWVMPSHPREAIARLRRRARLEAGRLGGGQARRRLLLYARKRPQEQPAETPAARAYLFVRQPIHLTQHVVFKLERDDGLTRVTGHAADSTRTILQC